MHAAPADGQTVRVNCRVETPGLSMFRVGLRIGDAPDVEQHINVMVFLDPDVLATAVSPQQDGLPLLDFGHAYIAPTADGQWAVCGPVSHRSSEGIRLRVWPAVPPAPPGPAPPGPALPGAAPVPLHPEASMTSPTPETAFRGFVRPADHGTSKVLPPPREAPGAATDSITTVDAAPTGGRTSGTELWSETPSDPGRAPSPLGSSVLSPTAAALQSPMSPALTLSLAPSSAASPLRFVSLSCPADVAELGPRGVTMTPVDDLPRFTTRSSLPRSGCDVAHPTADGARAASALVVRPWTDLRLQAVPCGAPLPPPPPPASGL